MNSIGSFAFFIYKDYRRYNTKRHLGTGLFAGCQNLSTIRIPLIIDQLGALFSDSPLNGFYQINQKTRFGDRIYYLPDKLTDITFTRFKGGEGALCDIKATKIKNIR